MRAMRLWLLLFPALLLAASLAANDKVYVALWFDGTRPADVPALSWLKGIARHKALNHLRERSQRRARLVELLGGDGPGEEPASGDEALRACEETLRSRPDPATLRAAYRGPPDAASSPSCSKRREYTHTIRPTDFVLPVAGGILFPDRDSLLATRAPRRRAGHRTW